MHLDLLAIAAHPDDVELTCGGTLLKMSQRGYKTGILDLTAGDMGTRGTPEQRIEEACEAAKVMLVSQRENMHFPDARLENTISARMSLALKIREMKPRVVVLPHWQGRHPDHYRCSEMGYEACFLAGLKKLELDGHRSAAGRDRANIRRCPSSARRRGGHAMRDATSGGWRPGRCGRRRPGV
jgi:bacillithiol biosynthesis deacetylase BshB1